MWTLAVVITMIIMIVVVVVLVIATITVLPLACRVRSHPLLRVVACSNRAASSIVDSNMNTSGNTSSASSSSSSNTRSSNSNSSSNNNNENSISPCLPVSLASLVIVFERPYLTSNNVLVVL